MRRINALLFTSLMFFGAGVIAAPQASAATVYTPGAARVDGVSGGPWNTSQGDSSAGSEYSNSDLFPTYTPGGSTTMLGGLSEPNLAVYPNAEATKVPYPSGVAGTPGPLDGYCSSLGANPETGTPVPQPAGSLLPFSPYYFPDVVRNADGSLTGYFDYRPKDAEEAITVAKSTDNGASWVTEGEALGENTGYCPTADTNDDGQGHPYVTSVGTENNLYTLQRPAGDNTGIGLLVHHIEPAAANPLAPLPANQAVGVDPNTFATSEIEVPTSGSGATIPVSTLGESGSPEHIVAGPYEDYSAPSPSGSIITCAGTATNPNSELTECKVAGSTLTVHAGDDLVQVIAKAEAPVTIPKGPNLPSGEGGLAELKILNGNSTVSPLSTYLLNLNAPNRLYIDGQTVYCAQSNSNPTTKLENCTTTGSTELSVHAGDAITADPIIPPGTAMTTGLIAPDGIVGTLPKYPGAPEGSTVVLYTEKILSYFIEGTVNGFIEGSKFEKKTIKLPKAIINYTPSVTESEQSLPASATIKIYLGTAVGSPIQEVICTGRTQATQSGVPSGSYDLTGCSGGSGEVKEGNWVGGPNAAIAPYSALEQVGEGTNSKSKGPEKLFGNNEDYSVLRAAYTTNGVNFTDLGAISGSTSGTGNDSGSYNDISNPLQTSSPSSTSPTNLSPGSEDTTELRFIGSRGTILTNPDGSYGMFLSGSWATDGDSDAFNQIFYTESTDGQHWSVPKVVLSTDYTFKASREQDEALEHGEDKPLGISAYYSGRAYGPAVVQNPNGTLTMVFSGYRLPKPITAAGTKLGTEPAKPYTVSEKDPAMYRNILTMDLSSASTPGVLTSTVVGSSDAGSGVLGAEVSYTASVAAVAPGAGTPTHTVSFSDGSGPIAGCTNLALGEGTPDTATCTTRHASSPGADEVTATYSGDSNYATSTSAAYTETTTKAATSTAVSSSDAGTGEAGAPVIYTASVSVNSPGTGTPTGAVSFSDGSGPIAGCESQPLDEGAPNTAECTTQLEAPGGVYEVTASYSGDANYTGSSGVSSETVKEAPQITSAGSTTLTEGSEGSFTVLASGFPAPSISESGALPNGVSFSEGTLSGTPAQDGEFPITFTASNGVGSSAVQHFTLTVDSAPRITSAASTTFTEGVDGGFTVAASGFPAAVISESGALPAGVAFEPFSDTLSGAASQEGTYPITFTASNGVGSSAVQHFTLTVDAPPVITSPDKATFTDHELNTFTVSATGTPAPTIIKWGNLPNGVSFSGGVLSGTPTETGTFQITFTASNGIGAASTQMFELSIVGLHVTSTSLPGVTPAVPYSQQLTATGGVTPYKWKVTPHTLPKGLHLSAAGVLSGKISAKAYPHGGSFPITVTVTDATKKVHQKATQTLTIVVS